MSRSAKKTGNKRNSLKVMKGGMSPETIEAQRRRTPQAQIEMLRKAPEKYNKNGKHIEIIYRKIDQTEIMPSGIYKVKVDVDIIELQYKETGQSWKIVGTISELSDEIIITIEKPHGSINPGKYLFSYYNDRMTRNYLIHLEAAPEPAEVKGEVETCSEIIKQELQGALYSSIKQDNYIILIEGIEGIEGIESTEGKEGIPINTPNPVDQNINYYKLLNMIYRETVENSKKKELQNIAVIKDDKIELCLKVGNCDKGKYNFKTVSRNIVDKYKRVVAKTTIQVEPPIIKKATSISLTEPIWKNNEWIINIEVIRTQNEMFGFDVGLIGHNLKVNSVDANSPAELAGLKINDIIISKTIKVIKGWNQGQYKDYKTILSKGNKTDLIIILRVHRTTSQKPAPAAVGGGRTLRRNLMRKSKRNKKRKRTKNKKRNNKGRNSRKRT